MVLQNITKKEFDKIQVLYTGYFDNEYIKYVNKIDIQNSEYSANKNISPPNFFILKIMDIRFSKLYEDKILAIIINIFIISIYTKWLINKIDNTSNIEFNMSDIECSNENTKYIFLNTPLFNIVNNNLLKKKSKDQIITMIDCLNTKIINITTHIFDNKININEILTLINNLEFHDFSYEKLKKYLNEKIVFNKSDLNEELIKIYFFIINLFKSIKPKAISDHIPNIKSHIDLYYKNIQNDYDDFNKYSIDDLYIKKSLDNKYIIAIKYSNLEDTYVQFDHMLNQDYKIGVFTFGLFNLKNYKLNKL